MTEPTNMTDEELVKLLAVEGMGWTPLEDIPEQWWVDANRDCYPMSWNPLTDASDMLMLIEAMQKKGFAIRIEWLAYPENHELPIRANVLKQPDIETHRWAETPQRAFCLAAVEALAALKESK